MLLLLWPGPFCGVHGFLEAKANALAPLVLVHLLETATLSDNGRSELSSLGWEHLGCEGPGHSGWFFVR